MDAKCDCCGWAGPREAFEVLVDAEGELCVCWDRMACDGRLFDESARERAAWEAAQDATPSWAWDEIPF